MEITTDNCPLIQFWLTIFKNVEMIADMVQEADEPALETLNDVTVTFTEV